MVIMYDSSTCGLAYSALTDVYGGQYPPSATKPYTYMESRSRNDEMATFNHVSAFHWNNQNPADTSPSAGPTISTHSGLALPVGVMTSHPTMTSCHITYGYPSLTSGLATPSLDLTYAAVGALSNVQTAGIMSEYSHRRSRLAEKSPNLPYYWRKKTSEPPEGMTRTRDKYRVVYTSKQRTGLESEYKLNKFLTCARRAEISKTLDLSERQIKIWFQNRRAKDRRLSKRTEESHVTSPETSDKHSGISGEDDEFPAISTDGRHEEHAYYGHVTAHAQQRHLPCDTYIDQSNENARPSCQFALHPGTQLAEQLYKDEYMTQSAVSKPVHNDIGTGVPPAGSWSIIHERNNAVLSTSPSEWQTRNTFMTSYNISPIGASLDTMHRV